MTIYQIRVKGRLEQYWSEWFDGLSVTAAGEGETILVGPVRDQAALHGLLNRVRDLGLPLIGVNLIGPAEPSEEDAHDEA